MSVARSGALAAMLLAGVATNGFSATPKEGAAPPNDNANLAAPSLDSVVGKKLKSIDGSLISLIPSERGLSREIVAPNGAVQTTMFTYLNEKLGTVSDSRDAAKVIGVFRITDTSLDVQYADGSSETLVANASGGISIEARSPANASYCTAWYPEGHAFSLDERKAALAQYASRIGLGDAGDKKPDNALHAGCGAPPAQLMQASEIRAMPDAAAKEPAGPRPAVLASAGAASASAAKTAAPKTADVAAGAHAIEVRTSEVRPIDAVPAPGTKAPETKAPQQLASIDLTQGTVAPNQKGASSCLSVESDGSHWGFRNHCGYTVQFAYCLMSGSALAACKDGAVPGSVAANGFGALVSDESLKETDVSHDFRWVACQGGAGEVIARLDETNPPSGRCVR
jgi:hypothetical protein